MVNLVQEMVGHMPTPFQTGKIWRILAQVEAPLGRWPRPMKCVNEPNGFPAPGTQLPGKSGLRSGRRMGCEQVDRRVVYVPASRTLEGRSKTSDRTLSELKRTELR